MCSLASVHHQRQTAKKDINHPHYEHVNYEHCFMLKLVVVFVRLLTDLFSVNLSKSIQIVCERAEAFPGFMFALATAADV